MYRASFDIISLSRLLRCGIASAIVLTGVPGVSMAATDADKEGFEHRPRIIERLEEESEGRIEVIVDEDLINELLVVPEQKKTQVPTRQSASTTGFRIQVFSDGRNQHSLEARAKARASAIMARFPKYRGQVYTFSSSPNWYTRVGNFRTSAEASSALNELKRAFPQFASEMRVVKSKIVNIK